MSLIYFIAPILVLIVSCCVNFSVTPLNIRLLGAHQPLSAGKRYDLLCQSAGSRPPAVITWWRDGQRLEKTTETVNFFFVRSFVRKFKPNKNFISPSNYFLLWSIFFSLGCFVIFRLFCFNRIEIKLWTWKLQNINNVWRNLFLCFSLFRTFTTFNSLKSWFQLDSIENGFHLIIISSILLHYFGFICLFTLELLLSFKFSTCPCF